MTATKAQKIRLGLFAIGAAAAAMMVLVVFAGLRFWERHDRYHIDFEDSVLGLEKGAVVSFGGIKVGTVSDISLAEGNLRKVRVTIRVKRKLPIRTDTTATLTMGGITGLKTIDLRGGEFDAPPLPPGGVIAVGESTLDRFERQAKTLMDQSQEMMSHATRVASNLAELTEPVNFEGMEEIVKSAKVASANLAEATGGLRDIVNENRAGIRRTVVSVEHASASAQHATSRAASMMDTFDREAPRLILDGKDLVGELRDVVRTNGSYLRSTMYDLRQASRNLKDMARDVRQQPSRLFFSKPSRERKLP
jgi:phospholipid/cholesterol/gamma-HCH transport system substrate-binding protein